MKDYNVSCKTFSYQVTEENPNLINQAITKTFFDAEAMKDIIKDDIYILDIFASGRNIYDAIPRNLPCVYLPLDVVGDDRYKSDQRVLPILSSDINKIKLDDKTCDVIFAPASKVGYGKYHASMFEIERIIKPQGHFICDQSRYWYNRQFNQLLFCNRGWDMLYTIEVNYLFQRGGDPHPTSRHYIIYRKQ
jgi:hypothetical protein